MTPVKTLEAADALAGTKRTHAHGWPRVVAVLGRHSDLTVGLWDAVARSARSAQP